MIKLGIRVANSITSGRGHFERCLAISNHFSSKIIWFLDEKNKLFESKIKNKDEIIYEGDITQVAQVVKAVYEKKVNIILFDSYNIDFNSVSKLFKNIPLCVFHDSESLLNADMVICPHPIEIKKSINAINLFGPRYAPISNKLILNKFNNKQENKINILISMGAYDSAGITLNIIKAIINFQKK